MFVRTCTLVKRVLSVRGLLVFGTLVFLAAYVGVPLSLNRIVQRELDAVRALSIQLSGDEPRLDDAGDLDSVRDAWHSVSEQFALAAGNASHDLGEDFWGFYRKVNQDYSAGKPWNGLNRSKRCMTHFTQAFDALREWEMISRKSRSTQLPSLGFDSSALRPILYAYCLRIRVEAAESRFDDAAETLASFAEFAATFDALPYHVTHRYKSTSLSMAWSNISEVAPCATDTNRLRAIQAKMRKITYSEQFVSGLGSAAEDWAEETRRTKSSRLWPVSWYDDQVDRANTCEILRVLRNTLESIRAEGEMPAFRGSPSSLVRPNPTPSVQQTRVQNWIDEQRWSDGYADIISQGWTFDKKASLFARCADVAIAVLLFEREHGRMPGSMEDLIPVYYPATPIDGIQSNWIRFREDGSDLVVEAGIPRLNGSDDIAASEVRMKRTRN